MKILGITGSPRGEKSGAMHLIRAVLNGTRDKEADVEVINLVEYDLRFKNACSICFQEGDCVYEDDFPKRYRKIRSADGIVLGSPVYFDLATRQMKMLIDRMADDIQCQSLTGKYGCAISTSGDHAEGTVVTYLNHFLQMLGATPVGGVGGATGRDGTALVSAESEAHKLGRTLADAISTERKYPKIDQFHQRFQEKFRAVISDTMSKWPRDYDLWVDQTWVW